MRSSLTKDGKIRAKKVCPFLSRCSQRTSKCPSRGNTQEVQFSCGLARLFSKSAPKLAPVIEQTSQEIESFDIIRAVELKKQDRYAGRAWVDISIGDKLYAK